MKMEKEKKPVKKLFNFKTGKVKSKFDKKKKLEKRRINEVIKDFLEKAGIEQDPVGLQVTLYQLRLVLDLFLVQVFHFQDYLIPFQ